MKSFLKKMIIRQINRNEKIVLNRTKQMQRNFKALDTVESLDDNGMKGYLFGVILSALLMFGFMFLGLYVLVAIYNALGIWFVLGAMVSYHFVKEGLIFFANMID
jgi:hypothetical protein